MYKVAQLTWHGGVSHVSDGFNIMTIYFMIFVAYKSTTAFPFFVKFAFHFQKLQITHFTDARKYVKVI